MPENINEKSKKLGLTENQWYGVTAIIIVIPIIAFSIFLANSEEQERKEREIKSLDADRVTKALVAESKALEQNILGLWLCDQQSNSTANYYANGSFDWKDTNNGNIMISKGTYFILGLTLNLHFTSVKLVGNGGVTLAEQASNREYTYVASIADNKLSMKGKNSKGDDTTGSCLKQN